MLENFSERIKKKFFSNLKKNHPSQSHTALNKLKQTWFEFSRNSMRSSMAQRWSHSAISRSIVILRAKNRCLRTRLKINASQTIPRSSNLYIVEGHEWRGGKKNNRWRENCAQHCERQMEGNRSNTGEDEGHGDSLVQKRQQWAKGECKAS